MFEVKVLKHSTTCSAVLAEVSKNNIFFSLAKA